MARETSKKNQLCDYMADKAAALGSLPGQEIPDARIKAVRPYRSMAHFSPDKPPVSKKQDGPLYPGTRRWTGLKEVTTGQDADATPGKDNPVRGRR